MPGIPKNNQWFLSRLTEIVHDNLDDESFGVSQLADKAGKSRSSIHRYLKEHSGETVSHFICRLRLEKAMALLQENSSSISEVAYEVGFSSPSYFIKCFHEKYGYSPGEYIKHKAQYSEPLETGNKPGKSARSAIELIYKRWYFIVVPVILLTGLILWRYVFFADQEPLREKSIVVLPLEYTSEDPEIESLATGVMEDILHRLHHVNGLKTKSLISYDRSVRNELLDVNLVKKMKVSYVLHGKIYKEKGVILVYVTLIDTKTGEELWRERYEEDSGDFFSFVSEVSDKIIEELKVILSSEEEKKLGKNYTDNSEAYKSYYKGRFFWHKRTKEDLIRSIKYFNEALKNDSEFALAYAGLADAYFIGAWWNWLEVSKAIHTSKQYAQQALDIDNSLSEAYATLGGIATYFDFDWKTAESVLKKAIELNPNYATAHQYYSEYLDIVGKRKEACIHIQKAIDLNPNAKIMYAIDAVFYYHEEKFDSAILLGEKVLEFNQNELNINWDNFQCYINLEKDNDAINELQKILKFHEPSESYELELQMIYSSGGINAVIIWAINWMSKLEKENYYRMAMLYMLAEDKDSALLTLEAASGNGKNYPRIYCNPEFKPLDNDPRFLALLGKMNLPLEPFYL